MTLESVAKQMSDALREQAWAEPDGTLHSHAVEGCSYEPEAAAVCERLRAALAAYRELMQECECEHAHEHHGEHAAEEPWPSVHTHTKAHCSGGEG